MTMTSRYYGPGGGLLAGLGQTPPPSPPATTGAAALAPPPAQAQGLGTAGSMLMVAGTVASAALAYHGYKRNNSVGWAVGWFFLGGMFWPIALPVALAQGFGKPRVKSNRRRSR